MVFPLPSARLLFSGCAKALGARSLFVLPAGQLPLRLYHHLLCACPLTVNGDTANALAPAGACTGSVSLWLALMP